MCLGHETAHIAIMLLIPGTKTFCRDECEEMIRGIVYICSALRSSDRTESQLYKRCTFKGGWPRHEAMKKSRYVKIHAQLQQRMLMTVTDAGSDINAQLLSELLHVAMQRRLILLGPLTGGESDWWVNCEDRRFTQGDWRGLYKQAV